MKKRGQVIGQGTGYKNGQFSLEFLLTYGWVFFIVVAGVAVIYSTGIFSFADFLPEKCEFLGQIRCIEYQMTSVAVGTAAFKVKVANDFGVDLVIYNATLTDSTNAACAGTSQQNISWPIDSTIEVNLTSCTGQKMSQGIRFDGNILLTYYRNNTWCASPPTNCLYTSVGQILVKIT